MRVSREEQLPVLYAVFFPTVDCWRNWSGPESDSRQPAECGVWRWKTVGHLQTGLYEGDILQIYL